MLAPPLAALSAFRRFVTYALIPHPEKPGKTIKRPTDVKTGLYCKAIDPAHQYSYAEAVATGRPVGFVIDEADGFWFLDIDGAYDGAQWSPLANDLCERLKGCAVEVSQSHSGLHLIGRGAVPPHACRNILLGLELYTHDRFVALTGLHAIGDSMFDATPAISQIVAEFFPPSVVGDIVGWTDEPVPEWDGPKTDPELLEAALKSGKNSVAANFGANHVSFEDLWNANEEALSRRWPGDKGAWDGSAVDAALASHLAFWTGKNCERIRGLMLQSALTREKWEDRPDYLETTIMKACAVVSKVATGRPPPPPIDEAKAAEAGIAIRDDREYLMAADQIDFFKGCVYVTETNKIWVPLSGAQLDKGRFDIVYGGHIYVLDGRNDKTTDSAFEAFTKSRAYRAPIVDRTCFRPEYPAGAVIEEEAQVLVNTFIPVNTPAVEGDPTPGLRHMELMIPDPADREILWNYFAGVVQFPGMKGQWWPVLQGAEGNGKSFWERLMAFCVGYRYSHLVNPEAMAKTGNQFNSWITNNLWVGIEEIYVGAHRRDFLDNFKATVTNDRIGVEGKGTNQTTGDNRCNGLMLTNHRDAVPISVDSRRYAIFYTAQQTREDCLGSGMTADYFLDLYDWFYGRNRYHNYGPMYGARVLNQYLKTRVVNRAQLLGNAPHTTSRDAVLRYSLGRAEQEILEAVDEGRPGFAGGWVSSLALDRMLEQLRISVPRIKRREMMVTLGFDYHPALKDGRVNNKVQPDNAKPRLFIREGHLARNLVDPVSIAKHYSDAQAVALVENNFAQNG